MLVHVDAVVYSGICRGGLRAPFSSAPRSLLMGCPRALCGATHGLISVGRSLSLASIQRWHTSRCFGLPAMNTYSHNMLGMIPVLTLSDDAYSVVWQSYGQGGGW